MRVIKMRKLKSIDNENYRHPEFLETLSTNEAIFFKLFIKREKKKVIAKNNKKNS